MGEPLGERFSKNTHARTKITAYLDDVGGQGEGGAYKAKHSSRVTDSVRDLSQRLPHEGNSFPSVEPGHTLHLLRGMSTQKKKCLVA